MRNTNTNNFNNEVDFFNFYAIGILEKLGETAPSQLEIDAVETVLKHMHRINEGALNRLLTEWNSSSNHCIGLPE